MAGRNTASPLWRRMTSCSCSHRGPVQEPSRVPDPALQHQIVCQRVKQLPEGGLGRAGPSPGFRPADSRAGDRAGFRPLAPARRGLLESRPLALESDLHGLRIPLAERETSDPALSAAPVGGDAAQNAPEPLRQRVCDFFIAQAFRRRPAGATPRLLPWPYPARPCAGGRSERSRVAPPRRGASASSAAPRARMDEGGERRIVARDAEPFQVMEGGADALRAQALTRPSAHRWRCPRRGPRR